jgi:hypothetical protein
MLLSSGRGRVRGKGRKLVVAMAVEGERSEERAVQSEVQDQVWLRGSSVAAEFWCVLFIEEVELASSLWAYFSFKVLELNWSFSWNGGWCWSGALVFSQRVNSRV